MYKPRLENHGRLKQRCFLRKRNAITHNDSLVLRCFNVKLCVSGMYKTQLEKHGHQATLKLFFLNVNNA